jgi:ATP phosphoribosyltransferase-like protein
MRAAGLHPIETLLSSQAVLIRSNKVNPANAALITQITSRIAGVIAAGKYVLCNYNIPRARVHDATLVTPGRRAATVSPLDDPEWVAVSSMVLKAQVADVMDKLQVSLIEILYSILEVLMTDTALCAVHWSIRHPHRQHLQLSCLIPTPRKNARETKKSYRQQRKGPRVIRGRVRV